MGNTLHQISSLPAQGPENERKASEIGAGAMLETKDAATDEEIGKNVGQLLSLSAIRCQDFLKKRTIILSVDRESQRNCTFNTMPIGWQYSLGNCHENLREKTDSKEVHEKSTGGKLATDGTKPIIADAARFLRLTVTASTGAERSNYAINLQNGQERYCGFKWPSVLHVVSHESSDSGDGGS
ncbi:hypothetical protein HNY73_006785 [Argiope bruennichi]|uniref:Uncharacterized protein n=1 Tax=Argiope bruennichi TaxID=94029 RepID=A0A8T0FH30_ARGBR|nr:hypothetical protein HNY73_006785 [Argiope bruennichi]